MTPEARVGRWLESLKAHTATDGSRVWGADINEPQLIADVTALVNALREAMNQLGAHGPCTNNSCSACGTAYHDGHAALRRIGGAA